MGCCKKAWLMVPSHCYYSECPVSESNQLSLRTGHCWLKQVMVSLVLTNYCKPEIQGKNLGTHSTGRYENKRPVLCACTMTSLVYKKQQEAAARKEIAKRRAKSKAHEAAAATASPPQSDKGSDETESDGDNPPLDNVEEDNDDVEESGDDDTDAKEFGDKESVAEKSNKQVGDSEPATTLEARSKIWFLLGSRDVYYTGLNLNEKGNPSRSIQEEPKIQIDALNEVLELKRLFEGYNMYWMAKTPGKYNMEMVCEFYANYYCTLEKKAPSKNSIKKELVLDSVRIRAIPVDILERTITRVLMGGDYLVPTRNTEHDYRIEAMKGIRKLSTRTKSCTFSGCTILLLKIRREKNGSQVEDRSTRLP
ncbi:hypothetical protein HAX54_036878 [Datura stramonium]|uniref:Uncharacterized protein n=1 Tax=Datura stramonium TaxID=4076 RepID=A0ABS8VIN9_DATST|nr:hypothetical protein [Datura stramonium]